MERRRSSRQARKKRSLNSLNSNNRSQQNGDNHSSDTSDIPGFYYDPQRKTYFRLPAPPAWMPSQLSKTRAADTADPSEPQDRAEKAHVLKLVRQREIGGSPLKYCQDFRLHCARTLCLKTEFHIPHLSKNAACLHLIGGAENSFFGCWSLSQQKFAFAHFDVADGQHKPSSFFCKFSNKCVSVTDVVFKENWDVVARTVICSEVLSTFSLVFECELSSFDRLQHGTRSYPVNWCSNDTTFSVAYNDPLQLVAFGSEGTVHVTSTCDASSHVQIRVDRENIHSLAFVGVGHGLFAGGHRGNLYYCNVRAQSGKYNFKVETGRHLLCHIQTISISGNLYVVCSGYDSYLAMIDPWARREVTRFLGHVNRDQKVRFNVDVKVGVISATGQDGHTKIWNLLTGEMVLDLEPPERYKGSVCPVHSVFKGPACGHEVPLLVVVYGTRVFVYYV